MFGNRDTKRKNTFKQVSDASIATQISNTKLNQMHTYTPVSKFAYSGAMDALAEYTAYEANEQVSLRIFE